MKNFVLILFSFISLQVAAQQRPHYTQYVVNNYILNPALSGIENYTDVRISGRDQWSGLEGAPFTAYLSAHMPLGKKDYKTSATSFAVPGENPRGRSYWENYTASAAHHGAGFFILNDKTGLYNRFSFNLSYAYHIGLTPKTNLSAGFSGGISRLSYDRSKSNPADPNDPAIGNTADMVHRIRPDLSAGLWLYSSSYFAGISAQQVIPQKVSFTDEADGLELVPHFFATAGYRFLLTEDVNMIPSVMFKYVPASPTVPQFDLNAKFQYRDLLWLGGSYRFEDGYAAMVGLNVGNTFNVGYSYDLTTTALNTVSRGSHEIIIGFLIGNRYADTCPRNVW